tara:strand:+ start:382 stop:489 length:108 start_codon:yes stop_codon:yes gene_type:complete
VKDSGIIAAKEDFFPELEQSGIGERPGYSPDSGSG